MRPTRQQLSGYSCSEFKTMLKRRGYKVHRDFFKRGCVAYMRSKPYRFRYWCENGFIVDIGEMSSTFDRWANSTEKTITFLEWRVYNEIH